MHGEIRHLIGHKKILDEKKIRAEIVRNGEIVEIDKDLNIRNDSSNRPEKLFVDGRIIAKSDNFAFRERIRMSSEGLVVILIYNRKAKKNLHIQFTSFGLPRFEDYSDELKSNAEVYLNKIANKKEMNKLDELERFIKEDIYSNCGKKPIIMIAEMES